MSGAKASVQEDMESLRRDASRLWTDLGKISQSLQELGLTRSRGMAEVFGQSIEENRRALNKGILRWQEVALEQGRQVDGQVRAKPYSYMMAAFGLGFFLGRHRGRAKS